MSETRLRALERAATGGDPEARERLLGERVRCGALSRQRLELAAYLGDVPAQRVTGRDPGPEALSELTRGLWDWGRDVLVRASVAAGRAWLPGWEQECGWRASGEDGSIKLDSVAGAEWPRTLEEAGFARRELEALEAWVCCPCAIHARAARESRDAALSPMAAVACALEEGPEWVERATVAALRVAARADGPAFVRRALLADLGAWATGDPDPIRAQTRLPRPEPRLAEWTRRGWQVSWDGAQLEVSLGTWTALETGHDREQLMASLDEELWLTRRWLPPRSGVDVDPFRALNAWAATRQWELRTGTL